MRSFLSVSRLLRASVFSAAIVGLSAALSPVAQAQNVVSYNVVLSAASPTFNRPNTLTALSAVGTNVFYQAQQFYVNTTGTYGLETTTALLAPTPADDTFLALYRPSFNPASGLTNLIALDDDAGVGALSLISTSLTANTQYVLVTTTFNNNVTGAITTRISGATGSTVTLGVVPSVGAPEPGSLSLLGMGLVSGAGTLGVVRRKRKAA